jgi:hypothetical protein
LSASIILWIDAEYSLEAGEVGAAAPPARADTEAGCASPVGDTVTDEPGTKRTAAAATKTTKRPRANTDIGGPHPVSQVVTADARKHCRFTQGRTPNSRGADLRANSGRSGPPECEVHIRILAGDA